MNAVNSAPAVLHLVRDFSTFLEVSVVKVHRWVELRDLVVFHTLPKVLKSLRAQRLTRQGYFFEACGTLWHFMHCSRCRQPLVRSKVVKVIFVEACETLQLFIPCPRWQQPSPCAKVDRVVLSRVVDTLWGLLDYARCSQG